MQPYQLGVYEKAMPETLELAEKLREAKAAGFDFLELSIDETDQKLARLEWGEKEIAALLYAQAEAGLPIRTICLSGHRRFPLGDPDPAARARGLEIMEKAIRLADKLGVRIIQIAGYDVYYKEGNAATRELFAAGLADSVKIAARHGVMLAFETMETAFMNTVEKAMEWILRENSPYLQAYPDLGNITCAAGEYGTTVEEDLRTGKGRLAAMHLKETRPGVFRELNYGAGHVDFDKGIATAMELGIRLFLAEFWYTGQENWREVLAGNNRFLRSSMECALP